MYITINDYIAKGYLVVSQELQLVASNIDRPILLYIDAGTVSCLYNNRILQYNMFEQLAGPLGLSGLHSSIMARIYTNTGSNMHKIRQEYIMDFMNKFGVKTISTVSNRLIVELSKECMDTTNLRVLRKQITGYNSSVKNFEFTASK